MNELSVVVYLTAAPSVESFFDIRRTHICSVESVGIFPLASLLFNSIDNIPYTITFNSLMFPELSLVSGAHKQMTIYLEQKKNEQLTKRNYRCVS